MKSMEVLEPIEEVLEITPDDLMQLEFDEIRGMAFSGKML